MTQSIHAIVWYLFIIWLPNLMRAMHMYLTSINRKPSWSNPSRCWVKGIDCVGPQIVGKGQYIYLGDPTDMCRIYKPHKGDMLEKNTLPLYPTCNLKKVYIITMTCQVNHSLIFQKKITHKNIVGLYNRHDRSSQSFFNFLEQKITHKNIVGLYNRHDMSSQSFFNFFKAKNNP